MSENKNLPFGLSKGNIKEIGKPALVIFVVIVSCVFIIMSTEVLTGFYENATHSMDVEVAREKVLPAPIYEQVVDFAFEEESNIIAAYEAYDAATPLGFCIETKAKGYDDNIRVVVGIDTEGKITGVEIVSMSETQGVGSKVKEASFLSQFVSKSGVFTTTKTAATTENQISVISGATVSSEAVCTCVNNAVTAVSQLKADREIKAQEVIAE